jgi:hypothetical protein
MWHIIEGWSEEALLPANEDDGEDNDVNAHG